MTLQSAKLEIIHHILQIEDESVIFALNAILKKLPQTGISDGESDFWALLSEEELKQVNDAVKSLEAGEGIDSEEVRRKARLQLGVGK